MRPRGSGPPGIGERANLSLGAWLGWARDFTSTKSDAQHCRVPGASASSTAVAEQGHRAAELADLADLAETMTGITRSMSFLTPPVVVGSDTPLVNDVSDQLRQGAPRVAIEQQSHCRPRR